MLLCRRGCTEDLRKGGGSTVELSIAFSWFVKSRRGGLQVNLAPAMSPPCGRGMSLCRKVRHGVNLVEAFVAAWELLSSITGFKFAGRDPSTSKTNRLSLSLSGGTFLPATCLIPEPTGALNSLSHSLLRTTAPVEMSFLQVGMGIPFNTALLHCISFLAGRTFNAGR